MAFTNTQFLKFDSEEQWKEVALAVGVLQMAEDEETGEEVEAWAYYTQDWAVDVIGIIYDPGTYDEEGNELTPPVPRDGWHVNAKWNGAVPLTFSTRAIYPVTPHRIFYGDDLNEIAEAAVAVAAEGDSSY